MSNTVTKHKYNIKNISVKNVVFSYPNRIHGYFGKFPSDGYLQISWIFVLETLISMHQT